MGHWKFLVLTATHSAGLFPSLASCPSLANRTAFSPLQAAVRGQGDERGRKPLGRRPWQSLGGPAPGRAEAARQGVLKEAGRRGLRWMRLSLPILPLLGQCNQGYPSPSLGPRQPAQQHSDTTASSSIFHQPGERGVREQGREGWSQREPVHQACLPSHSSQLLRTGSIHWPRPQARRPYWSCSVVWLGQMRHNRDKTMVMVMMIRMVMTTVMMMAMVVMIIVMVMMMVPIMMVMVMLLLLIIVMVPGSV